MTSPYQSLVVLTGAGISAESGLKTFRDADGLWENHSLEAVCTPAGFAENPALVYEFYNQRRQQLEREAAPNQAHVSLAEAERAFAGKFTLITQNVDNLHEQAGSEHCLHMHGQLLSARCLLSGKSYPWSGSLDQHSICPDCSVSGHMRPDIVWFGEIPLHMETIDQAIQDCDLFVAIGTSGNVYPAAGFVQQARLAQAHCVELNLEPSAGKNLFHEHHYGKASEIVPRFFDDLLG